MDAYGLMPVSALRWELFTASAGFMFLGDLDEESGKKSQPGFSLP
jgi:hypothetical protein